MGTSGNLRQTSALVMRRSPRTRGNKDCVKPLSGPNSDGLINACDGRLYCCTVIRRTAEISDIPIVACMALHSSRFAALNPGFNEFLSKTLNFDVLEKTLCQLLRQA